MNSKRIVELRRSVSKGAVISSAALRLSAWDNVVGVLICATLFFMLLIFGCLESL